MTKLEDWLQPVRFSRESKPRYFSLPRGSHWSVEADFTSLRFRRRGAFYPRQFFPIVLFTAAVTAFYVFMLLTLCDVLPGAPEDMPGWQRAIPLVAIGAFELLFFYGIISQIFTAVHTLHWEFSQGQVRYFDRYFGFVYRNTTTKIDNWTDLEVRLLDDDWSMEEYEALRQNHMLSELSWAVVLLNGASSEILLMNSQWDKKEALWVADVLLREQSCVM